MLIVSFLITVINLVAQSGNQKFEIGAGLAGFVYQGDLTPNPGGSFKTMKPGLALSGAKIMSSSFLLRTTIFVGGLKGDETKYKRPEYRQFRAFKFHSSVFELSSQIIWNPWGTNYSEKGFSPYVIGGAGISFLHIKRDASSFNPAYFGETSDIPARLAVDEQHSTPKARFFIPAGAGMRYNLSDRLAVVVEDMYRFPFTDYLDGFSQAANPKRNDHYHTIMAGLVYRIGNKNSLGCPVLKQ